MNITAISIEITGHCNLHCKHCYNVSGPLKNPQEMDLDTIQLLLTDIKENNQGNIAELWVSGGEPLLHSRFQEVIELLFSFGHSPVIATNGFHDESVLAKLIDVKSSIRRVHVSLEGLREANDFIRGKGVFDHITSKTIPVLKNNGFHVCVTTHVRKQNHLEMRALTELVINQLDCDLKIGILRPIGRAQKNMEADMLTPNELYDCVKTIYELKGKYKTKRIWHDWDIFSKDIKFYSQNYKGRRSCPAGLKSTITCTYKFDIYPCAQLRAPIFKLGNFKKEKILKNILDNPDFREIDKLLNIKHDTCTGCKYYKATCQGGCPAVAYGLTCDTSSLSAMDPYCFAEFIN